MDEICLRNQDVFKWGVITAHTYDISNS